MPRALYTTYSTSLPSTQSSSKKQTNHTPRVPFSTPASSVATLVPQQPTKDFEQAFANLSSSYGFAGQVPNLPPKTNKKSKPFFASKRQSLPASLYRNAEYLSMISALVFSKK